MRPPSLLLLLSGLLLGSAPLRADLAEFNAVTTRWYKLSQTRVRNQEVKVSIAPDDSAVVYELEDPDSGKKRLMKMVPDCGETAAEVAGAEDRQEFRAGRKGSVLLRTASGWAHRETEDGAWSAMDPPPPLPPLLDGKMDWRSGEPPHPNPQWNSPDGHWEVQLANGMVTLRDRRTEAMLTLGHGDESGVFRSPPLWAPDSSRFMLWKEHDAPKHEVHYIESSPKDQVQPKHFSIVYPKPGDEIDTKEPWIFSTARGDGPMPVDPALVEHPFELRNPVWRQDSQRLTFEYISRGFTKHHVIEMNAADRTQRVLVREEAPDFVFVYGNGFRYDLDDGREILWMSERDGWKHLYLLDGATGEVKRQITHGDWIVREVVSVDEKRREVLLKISGREPGQDPYFIHYARVSLDGGEPVPLTHANGTHDRFEHRPGGKYYTCRWSRVDHAPVTELHRWEDGSLVAVLAQADETRLRASGYPIAEPFMAKDREGKFDVHGIIIRPPGFDPAKKYPVVENIYAGPHDSFVPISWATWMGPRSDLAAFGFIVVQIDGRGTANRCREFHHFCYQNLKDAGLPDHIAWIRAAALERCPQMDLTRVGIYGGSAGGQSAMAAVIDHADFYKAAAADCGCHDNRMDKIWWNEQWMGWPVGPAYAANSNVTRAKDLKGALLLTVGEVDTNVDPSSTYQVINALIAADKDFEFLPMTGHNHSAGEDRYAQRRRVDFFRQHLGGPAEMK